ncbi:MAG TPA: hypothetical protein VHS96_05800 [Bacteroidia bacterium]|nr:hypothetical protein [Bacteroidia bacterium]
MEQQDRFDEAIKAKIGRLEDEPSARVWAEVRGAIGTVRPPQANPWIFRVAAAAAVLAVVGIGYMFMPGDAGTHKAMAIKEKTRAPRIILVPQDYLGKKDIYLTESVEEVSPAPQKPSLKQGNSAFANGPQPAPHPVNPANDSLKSKALTPFGPGLDPSQPEKVIVHQDAPRIEIPKTPSPDNGSPKILPVEATKETYKAIASNSTKRSIRVPGRDDLTTDNLRSKSGAILGAVTNGASEFLGLHASYDEKQEDDLKMTAFNADFGLFKIKRVKTVKQ